MVAEDGPSQADARFGAPAALTPAQLRSRRLRNIAIALLIAGLCVLFYVMTIAKLGGGFLNRPI